jgi:hypothetical protein
VFDLERIRVKVGERSYCLYGDQGLIERLNWVRQRPTNDFIAQVLRHCLYRYMRTRTQKAGRIWRATLRKIHGLMYYIRESAASIERIDIIYT